MKRILRILMLFVIVPVFLIQEGCKPKEVLYCQRMPYFGGIYIEYINYIKKGDKYRVSFIKTMKNDISSIVDTIIIDTIAISDTLYIGLQNEGLPYTEYFSYLADSSRSFIYIFIPDGKYNYIIKIDTLRSDTIENIMFYEKGVGTCLPEDQIKVSFNFNSKPFMLDFAKKEIISVNGNIKTKQL